MFGGQRARRDSMTGFLRSLFVCTAAAVLCGATPGAAMVTSALVKDDPLPTGPLLTLDVDTPAATDVQAIAGSERVSGGVGVPRGSQDTLNSITFASAGYPVVFEGLTDGVSEPAAWAMMLIGFGGAGAMFRRRGDGRMFA